MALLQLENTLRLLLANLCSLNGQRCALLSHLTIAEPTTQALSACLVNFCVTKSGWRGAGPWRSGRRLASLRGARARQGGSATGPALRDSSLRSECQFSVLCC